MEHLPRLHGKSGWNEKFSVLQDLPVDLLSENDEEFDFVVKRRREPVKTARWCSMAVV